MPSWIETRRFTTHPREGGAREVDFPLVNSREALLWMVQMHCIDMNAWYSRVDRPDRPDYVVFDLDPPDEPDGFELAIEVAQLVRELLDELELPGYVKTSGADGIHVLAPIQRRATFEDTYAFAEAARACSRRAIPGKVTTEWLKKKRSGVLVDHRQNGWGKTIASVYSVRPKPGAPVSTPLALGRADRGRAAARLHDGRRARARRASSATSSRRCSRSPARSGRRRSGLQGSSPRRKANQAA